ncbi:hypothetical protein HanIR_Chr15g0733491 [Helianthus annuus]|nr:hypothetical protein HanIR_Chr15g0733491 [Helianthus annuus]
MKLKKFVWSMFRRWLLQMVDVVLLYIKRTSNNLLWRSCDLDEISESAAGYYYFKFKSEHGLNEVLENGPWKVNNIPIFINKREPRIRLGKIELSSIPLWVTIQNIPLELWTRNGLSKIMSGTGHPLLMDKITKDGCLNQSRKIDFARVLVEVSAASNMPTEIEVEYPSVSQRPGGVLTLRVSYQCKPVVCSHCAVFGHSYELCKSRPKLNRRSLNKLLRLNLHRLKLL